MKTRQRILVPFTHGHSGSALLRRAGEIAAAGEIELLVVSVLDTRYGFEMLACRAICPASAPPASRGRAKRLDHDLMRHGWAGAATVIGAAARAHPR